MWYIQLKYLQMFKSQIFENHETYFSINAKRKTRIEHTLSTLLNIWLCVNIRVSTALIACLKALITFKTRRDHLELF